MTGDNSNSLLKSGIFAALISNILFGVLYIYGSFMLPMSGSEIFAWRMIAMLFGLWFLLFISGSLRDFVRFVVALGNNVKKWAMMLLGTFILGSQLWLFMWGPVNGEGINIAMGYFLFPLTLILGGWLFLHEAINRWQWLAITLAASGVANALYLNGSFSWATLWICVTYPVYYLSRRVMRVPALFGLTFDLLFIAPLVFIYLCWQEVGLAVLSYVNKYWLLIPLLGLISAAAMQLTMYASRSLPVALFGLFSYLEPFLLFMLAVIFLGEAINADNLITYSLIWLSLLVALADIVRQLRSPV